MLKKPLFLFALTLCVLCTPALRAATPEAAAAAERGRSLFDFGRWIDARQEFLRARAALTPTDREELMQADFYLAACAVELGDYDADMALRLFEERYPGSVYRNDVLFSQGSWYCAHNDMAQAREAFKQVNYKALTATRKQQYDVRMGYVEFTDGNYPEAYTYFDRIDRQSEYADHAHYYKSYIDYASGEYARAKEGFRALAKSDAYGDVVPFYLLQIEFREGNYNYVVEHGDELMLKAVPQRRAELGRVMAESWFHFDDYRKTISYLEAFSRDGGELGRDGNYLLGFSLYRTARYAEAAEALRRACGAEDELTQNASYHLADCYLRADDKQAAMQAFAMASDERFDATVAEDALFNYGKLQYELGGGAFNGAINVLRRYVDQYPRSPRVSEARTLLVAAYYNSHDYQAAYEAIKSVPSPDADVRAALQKITYFRALESYSKGDLVGAKRSLAESAAVNVSPKYTALSSFWQGEIAFAEGDFATAAVRYDAYLKRAPRSEAEYAMAWYNLGYCAFAREQMPQARIAFERFLSLRPTNDSYRADAYNRLGDTRYAAREFDAAIKDYDHAIAVGTPDKHYARYKRAVTLGILGRSDAKIASLKQILADGQGDYTGEASYELGRTYIARERYAEGAAALEEFVESYSSSPRRAQAYSDLGLAYFNMGDKERSLRSYSRVVTAAPQSAEAKEAMQGIREIYVAKGDVDSYFAYAEQAGMESDLTSLTRDSLSFAVARNFYLAGEQEHAMKSLRSYIKSYPKGYYMTDALYFLSDCYLRSGDKDSAIESLTELTAQGTNQYSQTTLEKLSELTFAAKLYDRAATAYRQLYDVSTAAAAREAAMTGYVRSTVAGGDAARIEAMAADVTGHADAGQIARREAIFAHAEQLRTAGRADDAVQHYKKLASEVRTAEGSAAGYYVIEAAFRSGDMDKTEKAVFAYTDKSPRSYWLAKSYLILGDVYVAKGDNFQARATFQSVADGYSPADDGIVAEARERIAKLN